MFQTGFFAANNVSQASQKSGVSPDLSRLFLGLFPSWITVLTTILAATVMLFVLTKYVWKPLKSYVSKRHNFIQTNLDVASKEKTTAIKDRQTAATELTAARQEAADIINNARVSAVKMQEKIMSATHTRTRAMLEGARAEITREKNQLKKETYSAVVQLALGAAEKVVQQNMNTATNRRLVEEFIRENGK